MDRLFRIGELLVQVLTRIETTLKMSASAKAATEDEGLWTAAQLAKHLGCSKSWVYDAAAAGHLPYVRVHGMLRFEPAAIRRWVAAGGKTQGAVLPLKRS